MAWRRLGLVFAPDGSHAWARSHAANPVGEVLDDALVRVWFSTRDERQRSSIGTVDVEIDGSNRARVISVAAEPSLAPGSRGAFDDSGCSVGNVVVRDSERWVYYMGWNLGVTVPWRGAIGVAIGDLADNALRRAHCGPVLDRSPQDPFSLSYPCVVPDAAGWRMYYGSHSTWGDDDSGMRHGLREATSADGIRWEPAPHRLLDPVPGEVGLSRPWMDGEHLWYAIRTQTYRLGCAERVDGAWKRSDKAAVFHGRAQPWEATMQTYPSIFALHGRRYLLYNGEGYGRTGFGLAVEVAS